MSKEDFIAKAMNIHGDEYLYDLVDYKNAHIPITIKCKVHGAFEQTPNNHLRGRGCKKCAVENQHLTTEEFLTKANATHNEKYTYGTFISMKEKMQIFCKEHGEFFQRPNNHLHYGHGCPFCAHKKKFDNGTMFVEKAKEVHGSYYDYSKVHYVQSNQKIVIHCSTHGDFKQTPGNHLQGRGCPSCAIMKFKRNTEHFIESAKTVHGEKYDYSLSNYETAKDKIQIVCSLHGIFLQTLNNHISQSHRCPQCVKQLSESKGEAMISILLNEMDIYFEREAIFEDLVNPKTGKNLRCDFFLPHHNCIIEYDGKQHFEEVAFGKDSAALNDIQYRDNLKNDYANRNNLQMIRIPYYVNIENTLQQALFDE